MTDQSFVLVPTERLNALEQKLDRLFKAVEGATITPKPEWVSIPDAVVALKVSRHTIYRKIGTGELKAKGSGKTRRVLISQAA